MTACRPVPTAQPSMMCPLVSVRKLAQYRDAFPNLSSYCHVFMLMKDAMEDIAED